MQRIICALLTLLFATTSASTGTITLEWTPVQDSRLDSYYVFYGMGSVGESSEFDVVPGDSCGATCSHTITDLSECQEWHTSVKSVDAQGNTSDWPKRADGSNLIIKGFPDPIPTGSLPNADGLLITGNNFRDGLTRAFFNGTEVPVVFIGCSSILLEGVEYTPGDPSFMIRLEVGQHDGTTIAYEGTMNVLELQAPEIIWRKGDVSREE